MSQSEQNQKSAASPHARKIKWVVGVLLLLFAAAAAMNLPQGYSDDLSQIGKGQAAVVLVRNKNAVSSLDLIHVLDGIRDQYAGQVKFLLTDFDTPEGRAFIAANNAADSSLVLFDASGNPVKILYVPQTTGSVQQEIASALGVKP